jgi:hypothetical protein
MKTDYPTKIKNVITKMTESTQRLELGLELGEELGLGLELGSELE